MIDRTETDRNSVREATESVKKYFAAQPMPTVPVESIDLPGLYPAARRYLEVHQCAIVEREGRVTVKYPEGTTSMEVLPRTAYSRFRIVLPDCTQLYESRPFLVDGDNCLWVPQEALQESV